MIFLCIRYSFSHIVKTHVFATLGRSHTTQATTTKRVNMAMCMKALVSCLSAEDALVRKRPKLSHGGLPTAVVLDIEGTVAPITFVTETLFPYAKARLRSHLEASFESEATQDDIALLRALVCTHIPSMRC